MSRVRWRISANQRQADGEADAAVEHLRFAASQDPDLEWVNVEVEDVERSTMEVVKPSPSTLRRSAAPLAAPTCCSDRSPSEQEGQGLPLSMARDRSGTFANRGGRQTGW